MIEMRGEDCQGMHLKAESPLNSLTLSGDGFSRGHLRLPFTFDQVLSSFARSQIGKDLAESRLD